MVLFSRQKKAFKVEHAHEPQPCVLLKYSPVRAGNHPHPPDETPGGDADEIGREEAGRREKNDKKFWRCRLLHFFRRKAGKYNLAKAEEVCQKEAGLYRRLNDGQTSLQQGCVVVEIHDRDHQQPPVSEVLPAIEKLLEQDIPQQLDVNIPASLAEEDKVEELDKDQTSLQHIVEIHPVSEVLISVKEQPEQDIFQPQDVNPPVSFPKDDKLEELDKDQISLQEIAEIHDLGEAPGSEVLPAAEGVQSLDNSTEDDEVEEPDNSHIFWRYEFGPQLGKGGYGYVQAGTRCKDGLKVAVKIAEKTPDMPYIRVPGHPNRLPMEIGLTLLANKGPSVPYIIKLLDWQDNPDYYVMVLERPMPSMSLFSFVKLRQRLKEGIARHFMWQVIQAANICCERGVFHRDIKLENLLVNPDTLEVKLIDFGCGTLIKDAAYVTFNGTDMFCPPEFNVDGRYYAKPASVWSLGILLFVMVCGYYPDDKDLQMIIKNEWFKPDLSQECCQMIYDCLHPDPQQRLILEDMQLHDWFMVVE